MAPPHHTLYLLQEEDHDCYCIQFAFFFFCQKYIPASKLVNHMSYLIDK